MLNVFKMDIRRTFHSKMFYICLGSMLLVTCSMIFFDVATSFQSVMGVGAGGMDMMGSMMGIGMAMMMIGIFAALHICGDFSSGFAKNIFTRHANPFHYIGGKLLSLTASGAIMLTVYTLVSMLLFAVLGKGASLPGGFGGLLVFLVEKVLSCGAFASIILLACMFTRKSVVGVVVGVIVSMSAIPMLLDLVGSYFGWAWISGIARYTISGLSNQAGLVSSGSTLITIAFGSLLWTGVCALAGHRVVRTKDV